MNDPITIYQDYKQNIIQHKEHFPLIEEFKEVIGPQNLALQTDGSIQVKHYVGFYQKGKTKLQVLPKIYAGTEIKEDEIAESLSFLFRLLTFSGYLSFKDLDNLDISSNRLDIFEIFIRIFIQKFLLEFNRAPHYEYVSRIENQQVIKGKILFAESIKQNNIHSYKHIVEFDDFSVDNRLNQLFKFVIHELLKSAKDGSNKMLLRQGLTLLEEVSDEQVSGDIFNRIQINRQNYCYENLFNFAKLFFYNKLPGLSAGKEHTFSFLVPLNLLFEKSVGYFMKSIKNEIFENIHIKYHNHLYFGSDETGEKKFMLEPDFIFVDKNSSKVISILDAKFKNPFKNGFPSIAESDLYQLTTYSSAYQCNTLFVIYPFFYNAPYKDCFLTKYILKTRTERTELYLLQIDITKEDIRDIQNDLIEVFDEVYTRPIEAQRQFTVL